MADIENKYKVRLIPIAALTNGENPDAIRKSQVVFDVTPAFSESRSAEYEALTPVHMPGAVQMYKRTNSRSFEITAHLISRNVQDALKNMAYLQLLRAWMMPYFGASDTLTDKNRQARNENSARRANQPGSGSTPLSDTERNAAARDRISSEGVQLKGAPPDVLYLYAYSNNQIDTRSGSTVFTPVNINRVPVVMTNLGITYPEDVDYIPVYDVSEAPDSTFTQPFPRKMDVSISLVETHSPREYERFDLAAYKLGNLTNF